MQQGDPRGELIIVQCTIEKTPPRKRRALVAREKALFRKHRKQWMQEALQVGSFAEIKRGFVTRLTASGNAFANNGAALMAREPIEHLVVESATGPSLKALGAAPHLAKLRRLELERPFWLKNAKSVAELRAFFQSKHLGKVAELRLTIGHDRYIRGAPPDLSELFHGVSWPGVKRLELYRSGKLDLGASLAAAKLPAIEVMVGVGATPAIKKAFPKVKFE
jgi:hypothetical protein